MTATNLTELMKKKEIPYWLIIILLIFMYAWGFIWRGIYT